MKQKIFSLLENNENEKALSLIENELKLNNSEFYLSLKGYVMFLMNREEESFNTLKMVAYRYPSYSEPYKYFSMICEKNKKYFEAFQTLKISYILGGKTQYTVYKLIGIGIYLKKYEEIFYVVCDYPGFDENTRNIYISFFYFLIKDTKNSIKFCNKIGDEVGDELKAKKEEIKKLINNLNQNTEKLHENKLETDEIPDLNLKKDRIINNKIQRTESTFNETLNTDFKSIFNTNFLNKKIEKFNCFSIEIQPEINKDLFKYVCSEEIVKCSSEEEFILKNVLSGRIFKEIYFYDKKAIKCLSECNIINTDINNKYKNYQNFNYWIYKNDYKTAFHHIKDLNNNRTYKQFILECINMEYVIILFNLCVSLYFNSNCHLSLHFANILIEIFEQQNIDKIELYIYLFEKKRFLDIVNIKQINKKDKSIYLATKQICLNIFTKHKNIDTNNLYCNCGLKDINLKDENTIFFKELIDSKIIINEVIKKFTELEILIINKI
ncbi:hypothetical protein CWI38_0084p0030 [Hamiltosporidium tvaerminnensis]|uniref:Uncharacterized protein n=1 Tax=Hamiltosporidium tvaerminnensis TaxID=1176355 RepID=A0A4Q9M135_9MICR|nr:hypothetical protein CWI38_0084p0030 [Hamiltosporidium tvaerminnensis]